MTFEISRTSTDEKPCEIAYVSQYNKHKWYVDIESIEDLVKLSEEVHCPLIVTEHESIEIYDDYRE